MKASTVHTRILASLKPAILSACLLLLAGRVTAQTFTALHSFSGIPFNSAINSDGANVIGGLTLSGNTLYGTAANGGSSGNGTVFAVNTDGTGFTTLHSFAGYPTDGGGPKGSLVLSGNTLYGTTAYAGSSGNGTVFAVNIDGTGFTTLHHFTAGNDGFSPVGGLLLLGSTLYGTASDTVFKLNTDGSGFVTLHSFSGSDGFGPLSGLVLSGNTLYGTASQGGSSGNGTVFAVNIDGTGFTTMHNFAGYPSDGAIPTAGLVLSGSILYGTAIGGGMGNNGTVFEINTDGTGFTTLYSFTYSDGGSAYGGVVVSGTTLYGALKFGGDGALFKLNTDGTGFTTLYSFTSPGGPFFGNSDGTFPEAGLILSGSTLYGTATGGGFAGNGTVFKFSLVGDTTPPVLSVPGTITVNATSPAGAVVTFSVTALDNVDPNPTVTSSPASGSTFPIGTTHVTCTATDASGNSANSGFDVVVLGASQQTTSLISLVQTFNFVQGINNSLDTKLQDAQAAIAAAKSGDLTSTCGYLRSFINEVQAQSGKNITANQASQMIASATQLKAVVGCP